MRKDDQERFGVLIEGENVKYMLHDGALMEGGGRNSYFRRKDRLWKLNSDSKVRRVVIDHEGLKVGEDTLLETIP